MASALLVVLFVFYVIPTGINNCYPHQLRIPVVQAEQAFYGKPPTTLLSIAADGSCFIGTALIPRRDLTAHLRSARESEPSLPLEIAGDGRLSSGAVVDVLRAARDAGYTEAYVFGRPHSLLDIAR